MTIGERIKELRKAVGCTQQEFANRMGGKQNTIASYEMGRIGVSDIAITSIVREFGVNEKWLRTGEGEMFAPKTELDELTDLFAEIMGADDNDAARNLAIAFAKLSKEQRKAAAEIAAQLARNMDK